MQQHNYQQLFIFIDAISFILKRNIDTIMGILVSFMSYIRYLFWHITK